MANAKTKIKSKDNDPIKLKQERSLLVQTIGDEAYACEVYKANILKRSMRINEINLILNKVDRPKEEQKLPELSGNA